ncbi:branched-chain amino acid ABC transporter permease [Comamonas composti]|uniref:branched-chain amino acid ABC transporter permease n=1 Tax=Comamonas composti TaxID=408558 RepID=UPI0003FC4EA5|nr:branched-chain amino acid ABC transporter permease [Comamonas composti]
MSRGLAWGLVLGLPALGALAALPLLPWEDSGYAVSMAINLLMYVVLATAWAIFSGTGGYVSLATAAFFGLGAYAVAVLGGHLAWPWVLACAAGVSALVAVFVGLATLRLSGVYFVIFSFGLAELIRQFVIWYEANVSGTVGRYVFLDISQAQILWQLCALTLALFFLGWLLGRSRLGLAMRMIGDDELVARHCGVNTARTKLLVFALSAVFMGLAGAVMAPRWTYIDPQIAFNPMVSFQTLIMALLGGAAKLHGPLLGVIPMVLLFEYLWTSFPNYYSILLGLSFVLIVYLLPRGVLGLLEKSAKGGGA